MSECLFCKIVEKKIEADLVYEDNDVVAFHDISPVAPTHILVIPKVHIENVLGIDGALAQKMLLVIQQIVKMEKIEKGFRLVTNTGEHGGQTVYHLHWHILSGRHMGWPPG
ncbi:MAG TPA: histidine triad nucleotide-binding protein [Turneriella sp.]|nr:histidine triad nucleotide-binding protein [Turneriella sp.]